MNRKLSLFLLVMAVLSGCNDDDSKAETPSIPGEENSCRVQDGKAVCVIDGTEQCIDINANKDHCGSCENKCVENKVCEGGQCVSTCSDGIICEIDGEEKCINDKTDKNHCGNCTNKCTEKEYCVEGNCTLQCADPNKKCTVHDEEQNKDVEVCVNPSNDGKHCGECNNECQGEKSCVNGTCELVCNGTEKCLLPDGSEQCKDTNSNKDHCGECNHACGSNEQCSNGICVIPLNCATNYVACMCPADEDGNHVCESVEHTANEFMLTAETLAEKGWESTDFMCLNPAADASCGVSNSCDYSAQKKCGDGKTCQSSQCACPEGLIDIGDDGCISPLNPKYCGAKNSTDKGQNCTQKADTYCKLTVPEAAQEDEATPTYECACRPGFAACGDNTTCKSILDDNNNCGACGNNCGDHASCDNGVCRCDEGYAKCKNKNECIDSSNKVDYCGAKGECNDPDIDSKDYIGTVCLKEETCENGVCLKMNYMIFWNGEYINPKTDNRYCGIKPDGTYPDHINYYYGNCDESLPGSFCSNKQCLCPQGFELSDKSGKAKCYNIEIDPFCCGGNCNKCGDKQVCKDGVCSNISECTDGYINCEGHCLKKSDYPGVIRKDGTEDECECGRLGSSLDFYCDDDNNPNNGCFGGIRGDIKNCGGCNIVCDSIYSQCDRLECLCAINEKECKYTAADGFDKEVTYCQNLESLHMTGCRTCQSGWGNLNGDWKDGCETDLSDNVHYCGDAKIDCAGQIGEGDQKVDVIAHANGIKCENSKCTYVACEPGYGDCDRDNDHNSESSHEPNGCETELTSNTSNCGACGIACVENQSCEKSVCCYTQAFGNINRNKEDITCCQGLTLYEYQSEKWECKGGKMYRCSAEAPTDSAECWK